MTTKYIAVVFVPTGIPATVGRNADEAWMRIEGGAYSAKIMRKWYKPQGYYVVRLKVPQ